jgi:hypothetical protein
MLRKKLIKNKSFKEFVMPSYIEYLQTLSYSTCRQYKSYKNVIRLKKNLLKHATRNGVTLINSPGDNDYQNFISNIIKPKARRAAKYNEIIFRAKRIRLPKIEIEQQPMDNAMPVPMAQPEQPMADATLVHMVQHEQPMADAAPVPMVQPEQPMEKTLVHTAEQPMEQPMADATLAPSFISLPHCTNTPFFNGARRVVHTNTLVLNGLVIEVDPDTLMVNATQMCKAAGKRWNDYRENNKSNDYIFALESKTGIPVLDLIKSNRGGDHSGTMVHRLIAYDL